MQVNILKIKNIVIILFIGSFCIAKSKDSFFLKDLSCQTNASLVASGKVDTKIGTLTKAACSRRQKIIECSVVSSAETVGVTKYFIEVEEGGIIIAKSTSKNVALMLLEKQKTFHLAMYSFSDVGPGLLMTKNCAGEIL